MSKTSPQTSPSAQASNSSTGNRVVEVMGWRLAPPRLTLWAFLYFAIYGALPFLLIMALLDLGFYALMKYGFDTCYGVLCLLEGR